MDFKKTKENNNENKNEWDKKKQREILGGKKCCGENKK